MLWLINTIFKNSFIKLKFLISHYGLGWIISFIAFSCCHIYIHMMQITFHSTCKISILAGKDWAKEFLVSLTFENAIYIKNSISAALRAQLP